MLEPPLHRRRHTVLDISCWVILSSFWVSAAQSKLVWQLVRVADFQQTLRLNCGKTVRSTAVNTSLHGSHRSRAVGAHRGVRNPMKFLDIGFLKTEPNWTDLKIQKPKTRFPRFGFQKPTSSVWGQFFTLSHSQFILQRDRINSQSIFLHAVSLHF